MASVITLEKAKEMVRSAVERYPNRVNPTEGGRNPLSCLYTSRNGKSHCIAGQVFADAGVAMPPPDAGSVIDLPDKYPDLRASFTEDAWEYLYNAQCIFDGGHVHGVEPPRVHVAPRKWKTALKMLEALDGAE